jgi:hypothetical protein
MKPKKRKTLHVYLIDTGDSYYYVAPSASRALTLYLKDHTYPRLTQVQYRKECPDTIITQCDDDNEFTITSLAGDTGESEDEYKTLTMRKWTKEMGEGCLATSDY